MASLCDKLLPWPAAQQQHAHNKYLSQNPFVAYVARSSLCDLINPTFGQTFLIDVRYIGRVGFWRVFCQQLTTNWPGLGHAGPGWCSGTSQKEDISHHVGWILQNSSSSSLVQEMMQEMKYPSFFEECESNRAVSTDLVHWLWLLVVIVEEPLGRRISELVLGHCWLRAWSQGITAKDQEIFLRLNRSGIIVIKCYHQLGWWWSVTRQEAHGEWECMIFSAGFWPGTWWRLKKNHSNEVNLFLALGVDDPGWWHQFSFDHLKIWNFKGSRKNW